MVLVQSRKTLVNKMPSMTKLKNLAAFKGNILKSSLDVKKDEIKELVNTTLKPSTIELNLEENAKLIYITFDSGYNGKSTNYFNASLKKNATLEIYNIVTSGNDATIKGRVDLNEEGATVNIINLLLSTDKAICDSFIDIYHNDKHTNSDLTNYAIAKDCAKLNLDNNATIKKGCSKSVAHQHTKGLTLSKTTKIKALPNLFIDEYDVIASHACAIGSINKEDLFYLMSRGLTEAEASSIVVMGYVKPILDHIEDSKLKDEIYREFANKLKK